MIAQQEIPGVRTAYLEQLSKKAQARIQPSPSVGVPAVAGTKPGQISRIEQFRSSPPGTTGRAFLSARRPVGNLMKRRSRRLG